MVEINSEDKCEFSPNASLDDDAINDATDRLYEPNDKVNLTDED